jgi:hypothetical protein
MISLKTYVEYGAPLLVIAIGLFLLAYDQIERAVSSYFDRQQSTEDQQLRGFFRVFRVKAHW